MVGNLVLHRNTSNAAEDSNFTDAAKMPICEGTLGMRSNATEAELVPGHLRRPRGGIQAAEEGLLTPCREPSKQMRFLWLDRRTVSLPVQNPQLLKCPN